MIPSIFLFVLLFGGANAALIKYAGAKISPIDLVFFRSVIAAVAIAPFIGKIELTKFKNDPKSLTLAGLLFAANWILFAYGIQKTSVIMGQLIYVPTSLIVAGLGYFILKEKLSQKEIIGLILSLVGITYLILGSFKTKDILSFGTPFGNFLVVVALFSWAFYLVLTRKISNNYKPLTIIFVDFIISGLISAIFFILNFRNLSLTTFNINLIMAILAIAFLSSIAFFFLNQWIVKHSSAFVSSMLLYPVTLSAIIYGIIFFKEKLDVSLLIGGFIMLIGVFLSTLDTIRKK
ncbi:MAG: Permease, DMT family protein [Candidatus Curtissbacteria bacterium GW2011_GWC2_38_9]|uniref:EamA domain-containing protein n=3 Tax=Candidatus Curtissiibacteriota TaxID=1752717 RepID=A0A1F5HQW9_9BACT|nr:MAG: Permease, DMT family protein [Candidatus Curtissbacteria bacterium GW2011_GWC2_38_9]KKS04402.1 MAG: Permease, DMT family protein [Candidatus Curtissbacteria bacterium GW2011_GWA2_41_24]OGE06476.1 MAG: hypothetical protein A2W70_01260 [Candidatus Curtissbacteria bacterium RIFCSPLOWO2_02_41_11]